MLSVTTVIARRTLNAIATRSLVLASLAACSSTTDSITGVAAAGAPATIQLSSNGIALDSIGARDSLRVYLRDAAGQFTTGNVAWSTANAVIADVSASGVITARAAGVTTVRATAGGLSASVDVRVLGVRALRLADSTVLLRVGDKRSLSATFDADANVSQQLRFSSSNASVASVDANGAITALAAGTATIAVSAAADPRVAAFARITVNPARQVAFAPGGTAITLRVGDDRTVAATVDVDDTESHDILWSSGNPAVATVADNGVITAVGEGTAIIRAASIADPRARAELVLTVLPARTVTLSVDSVTLAPSAQQQVKAKVTIEAGLSSDVVWVSSDTTIATVDETGLVTGVAPGSAVIIATSVADPTRSARAYVTVADAGAAGLKGSNTNLRGTKGGR